jgi:hypothetical protein
VDQARRLGAPRRRVRAPTRSRSTWRGSGPSKTARCAPPPRACSHSFPLNVEGQWTKQDGSVRPAAACVLRSGLCVYDTSIHQALCVRHIDTSGFVCTTHRYIRLCVYDTLMHQACACCAAMQQLRVVALRISGGGSLTRHARRFPSTRWQLVPGATRTTLGFGMCPSFKGHFLSRRAQPQRYDSHCCMLSRCACVT